MNTPESRSSWSVAKLAKEAKAYFRRDWGPFKSDEKLLEMATIRFGDRYSPEQIKEIAEFAGEIEIRIRDGIKRRVDPYLNIIINKEKTNN